MTKTLLSAAVAAIALGAAVPALAQQAGDMTLGFGVGWVEPKDGNGELKGTGLDFDVGPSARPTLTFEYFVMDNVGVEVLAATPFRHEVKVDTLGEVAKVTQLPPTISVQYHIPTGTAVTPLVGVGINYTTFWDEDSKGAIKGAKVRLDDSWGVALHAGLDYAVSERGAIRADVRWIDIDSDVEINGADAGTAEIDPWVFGVSYIYKF